jgi:hypothetical protein
MAIAGLRLPKLLNETIKRMTPRDFAVRRGGLSPFRQVLRRHQFLLRRFSAIRVRGKS